MQLPRGRFHKIIKSTATPALIEEMRAAKFTGICRIVLGSESATLVLNEGSVVLAEYGGLNGCQALDGVLGIADGWPIEQRWGKGQIFVAV